MIRTSHHGRKAGTAESATVPADGPLQIKLQNWPAIDQALWAEAFRVVDVLDEPGPASGWVAGTRLTTAKSYGRWLGWLDASDALDAGAQPLVRVTQARVAAYVAELKKSLAPLSIWSYVQGLAMALTALQPEADLDWLWQIVNMLKRGAPPVKRKRDRIVPARDLFEFGLEHMAAAPPADTLMAAVQFRDGLMIAMLAARPIRIRNLQMMEFGKHLVRSGDIYWLRFASHETKTHMPISLALPKALTEAIDIYATIHRPLLLAMHVNAQLPLPKGDGNQGVWISRWGNQMCAPGLHERVTAVTKKRFGHSINPHLFRDCAATSIALGDKQHIHVTMGLLGHSSPVTSERYYNHALTREAANTHQRVIAKLRRTHRTSSKLVNSK